MKNKTTILILLCSVLLFSCNKNSRTNSTDNSSDNNDGITIKIDVPSPKNISYKQTNLLPYLDSIKYVKLELSGESMIGSFDKIEIYHDRIYVLDMQTASLFVFTIDGDFIFKINKRGPGPEEYMGLDFFDIDRENKHLVLTDLMGYYIMRYDMNGKFISRQKIPFWVEWVAPYKDKGTILYANYRNNQRYLEEEYNLFYMDSTMNIEKAYFPYNSSTFENKIKYFPVTGSMYYHNDELFFLQSYFGKIHKVTTDGLENTYNFDFGEYNFDSSYMDKPEFLEEYFNKGLFYRIATFFENDNFIQFIFYSPFDPVSHQTFYSKKSENMIYSPGFYIGEKSRYYIGISDLTYDNWFVSEVKIESLLNWKEYIDENNINEEEELGFIDRKKITEEITLEDNSVLVFYKLKDF